MTDTQQRVAMGYIKDVFGTKGWLKIAADTEYPSNLLGCPEWLLSKNGKTLDVVLEAGKPVGDELQIKFEGIDNHDQAFALRGYTVEIPRAELSPTGEDEYYRTDLVSMTIVNKEGITLGTIKNLMETGTNGVLITQGIDKQILTPLAFSHTETANHDSKTITADWGLDY